MQIRRPTFQFAITLDDLHAIRVALTQWGKSPEVVQNFTGAELHRYYEAWSQFVETDWEAWDIAEYRHDIGCRYWIQIALEYAAVETRIVLGLDKK